MTNVQREVNTPTDDDQDEPVNADDTIRLCRDSTEDYQPIDVDETHYQHIDTNEPHYQPIIPTDETQFTSNEQDDPALEINEADYNLT